MQQREEARVSILKKTDFYEISREKGACERWTSHRGVKKTRRAECPRGQEQGVLRRPSTVSLEKGPMDLAMRR